MSNIKKDPAVIALLQAQQEKSDAAAVKATEKAVKERNKLVVDAVKDAFDKLAEATEDKTSKKAIKEAGKSLIADLKA